MRTHFILTAAALALALAAPALAAVDPDLLAGLEARSIGPAAMSGRIAAIESTAANPELIYVGAATGGVWKSVDGGLSWEPVFDDQPVASIGAVALDPGNPDVVWVGTGEGNVRNSVSVGNGIYRSNDGGRTWRHLGLDKTERIHRVIVDPRDSRVVYAAALGQAWGENPERGVFKTTDGGRTWRRVLYVDERTGAADLVIDPGNPDKLFAAMWDYRRHPWSFRSGGPGSGLHVSYDGGETWRKLTEDDGLPKGILGRIGVAVAPSDPNIVYALVEAQPSALARSEDGGRTWRLVNTESDVSPRPFYYSDLRVDPRNPNRVYRLASRLDVSDDGGKTFRTLAPFRSVHPDHHALWIDPRDGGRLLNGNDGGVYISRDRGRSWSFVANLPVAQFYHVRVDNAVPYNVYGGLQDNGSWKGPGTVWENGGIRNQHWQEVQFGDGFDTAPDPGDP
ncbi:MAG: WD40/YVTN/BNR-like repeat-containing protein, partial [Thermoanaerobaculia bacterium]